MGDTLRTIEIPRTATGRELRLLLRDLHPFEEYAVTLDNSGALLDFPAYPLTFDMSSHSVHTDGQPVGFTRTEFGIYTTLASRANEVMSRETILTELMGSSVASSSYVDTHRGNVAKKLRELGLEDPVRTVRGVGFIFDSDPSIPERQR